MSERRSEAGDTASPQRRLPVWKKALVLVSILLMLGGLAMRAAAHLAGDTASPTAEQPAPTQPQVSPQRLAPTQGLLPRQDAPAGPESPPQTEPPPPDEPGLLGPFGGMSPALFQLGFGFFAGFCIAYALRLFLKTAAAVVGVVLLIVLGLQYGGVLSVDWSAIERAYDSAAGWLGIHFSGFGQFITRHIPSVASMTAGLFIGFRRN